MSRLDVLPFLKHRVVDVELLLLGVGPAAADVMLDTLLKLRTGTLLHKEHSARKPCSADQCSQGSILSLIPRPLPDFISSRGEKSGEGLGSKLCHGLVITESTIFGP